MGERVLIIGAGPAGLATMACLKREGVAARLVDRRGITGGAYHHIHPGITLTSPTRYTQLPGLPLRTEGEYVTVAQYRDYLECRPDPGDRSWKAGGRSLRARSPAGLAVAA